MKTVKNIAELQGLALKRGAELLAPGMRFNSGRATTPALRREEPAAPPAPAPAPPSIPEGYVSREAVERMLAEHNARIMGEFSSIIAQLQRPAAPSHGVPREWDFEITYDQHHAITNVRAKAKP
jgi:hypothetical protein